MKKKLVVLVNDSASYDSYVNLLRLHYDVELIKNSTYIKGKEEIPSIDLILFTGGEDVTPDYYNQMPGKYTSYNSERDSVESKMFRRFPTKLPKLGICRGAQFLTVMSGGSLIQHVENHGIGGTHSITFDFMHEGYSMPMTSTHHQMMYPFNMDTKSYILCAHSTNHLSPKYWNGANKNIEIGKNFLEPEIVFYPQTNSLAIQGHPESNVLKEDDKNFILTFISRILKL